MQLEVAGLTGAGHGERSPDRLTWRNGYRERDWETAPVPSGCASQLHQGSYFPAFLERTGWEGVERGRHPGSWSTPAPPIIASSAD